MPLPTSFGEFIGASQTLGSAAGRAYPLGNNLNPAGSVLSYVHIQFTTTAKAGSRILTLQLKDQAGNVLYAAGITAAQAASSSLHYFFGAAAPIYTVPSGQIWVPAGPLPEEMPIPLNAVLQGLTRQIST